MFETIEIRAVKNGFVVTAQSDGDTDEFVFDSSRKAVRFVRNFVEAKTIAKPEEMA